MAEYVKNYSGVWVNGAGGSTPITATALNNLETQYDKIKSETLTLAGTKTFSTIPELPASNPTTDNQATRKLYVDSRVGTVLLSPAAAYTDGTIGIRPNGILPCLTFVDAAAKYATWLWYVPPIFTSISSIKVIWGVEAGSSTDMYCKLDGQWAAHGEAQATHAETGTYGVVAEDPAGNGRTWIQAMATPLTLANLAAGDILALKFTRDGAHASDTIAASVYIHGLLITYV